MDFSGTMDLVMGSGQIFGVTLLENFRLPLLLPQHCRVLAAVARHLGHLV